MEVVLVEAVGGGDADAAAGPAKRRGQRWGRSVVVFARRDVERGGRCSVRVLPCAL